MRVMVQALGVLPLPRCRSRSTTCKLIQGFYRGLGIPDVMAAISHHRQLDKVAPDVVAGLLVDDAEATPSRPSAVWSWRPSGSPTARS
jgi:histidyl-tRNA synthetase